MKISAFHNMCLLASLTTRTGALNIFFSRTARTLVILDPRGYLKLIKYNEKDEPEKDFFERLKTLLMVNPDNHLNLSELGDVWMRLGYDKYVNEQYVKRLERTIV